VDAKIIYLDNNATTRCAPEVFNAMLPFFQADYGNPASPHLMGRRAAEAVEKARQQVADCLECDAREVFFTGGATEANNLVLLGLSSLDNPRRKIVTSAIEHKSVLEPLNYLSQRGFSVVNIPASSTGLVDLSVAEKVIDKNTLLVSIQAANNEVGTIQPIRELTSLAHANGAFMHCDAAQVLGKVPVSISALGADFLSFSSHKAYGPKGIGFLVARRSFGAKKLVPVLFGGGQEAGLRPGTLNVPGIVGTGVACEICLKHVFEEQERIARLRDELETRLRERSPLVSFACASSPRLPGTTSILIHGITADVLITHLPDLCISIGSACSSGALTPSHVLTAIGYSRDVSRTAVRLSLGRYNTNEEIEYAVARISCAIDELSSNGTFGLLSQR